MQFFCLNSLYSRGIDDSALTDCVVVDTSGSGEAKRCTECGKYLTMLQWLPPYQVELETWGQEYGDVVNCIGADDFLVSERFRTLYEESGLVGLSGFQPVEVVSERRRGPIVKASRPAYFRAVVCRSVTTIDQAASGIEWAEAPTCQTCLIGEVMKRWKRVVVDQTTWSEEDIFFPRGKPGEIVASSRFAKWCSHHQFRNVVLIPSKHASHDFYPAEEETLRS